MMIKPGTIIWPRHGARGQKISFSNRKADGEKTKAPLPARSGKFAIARTIPPAPDSAIHAALRDCALARSAPTRSTCHVCSSGASGCAS
jgi:hypothetical protein